MTRRTRGWTAVLGAALAVPLLLAGPAGRPALAAEPIKIGEINSYSGMAAFTIPYRNGWTLAIDEINAKGGLLGGRPLEVVSRDDQGRPEDAVRLASELVDKENVALLSGTFFSHVGLAVSDFAKQRKVLFVASEPLTDAITWQRGHRYTFRLRPSTYMQAAMLAEEAAKLPATRWATIAPNYEYGQAAVAAFKTLLKAKKPEVTFVAEQWPPQGKIDAGPTVQALSASNPEAIFNVTFGADLGKFVREGQLRGLFKDRPVVSLLTGEPEYLDPLRDEAPVGWIVTGYPWDTIQTPEHTRFLDAYRKRFNDYPRLGSVVGYATMKAIAAAIEKARSTDTEKLVEAMRGLEFETPFGAAVFRAVDHQATVGAYVGKIAIREGKGVMVDWRYAAGEDYLPSEEAVRTLRPKE